MAETNPMMQKERAGQAAPESTRGGVFYTPRVDIYETDNELLLYADVPGARREDVDLRYEQGELLLHARVQPRHPDTDYLLQEYGEGDYFRVFAVHESVDGGRIEAELKNGVLIIHLPKAEAARPRQISVRGS